MTQPDYIEMILQGIIDNPKYLDQYFYRKCKEAEEKHIEYIEFFNRLFSALDIILKQRDPRHHEDMTSYYQLIELRKSQGKTTNDLTKPKIEDIWINLIHLTGGKYVGHLQKDHLDHIQWAIVEAGKKILSEKTPQSKSSKKQKAKPETLLQIWEKDEDHYNKVIDFLKEECPTIGCPFINDELKWQNFDHHIKYLATFTRACIDKKHIKDIYSAPQFRTILKNTFQIDFNPKPFQSIVAKDFAGYLDVFVNMP